MNIDDTFLFPEVRQTAKSDVEGGTLAVDARGASRPIAMFRRLGMAMAIVEGTEDLLGAAALDEGLEIVARLRGPVLGRNFSGVWADTRPKATTTPSARRMIVKATAEDYGTTKGRAQDWTDTEGVTRQHRIAGTETTPAEFGNQREHEAVGEERLRFLLLGMMISVQADGTDAVTVKDWYVKGAEGPATPIATGTYADPSVTNSALNIIFPIVPADWVISAAIRETIMRERVMSMCSLALTSPRLAARCACTPVARGGSPTRTVMRKSVTRSSARAVADSPCSAPLRAEKSEDQGTEGTTTRDSVTTEKATLIMHEVGVKDGARFQELRRNVTNVLDYTQADRRGAKGTLHKLDAENHGILALRTLSEHGKETSNARRKVRNSTLYEPWSGEVAQPL